MTLREFMIWWADGLRATVPESLRRRLAPAAPRVVIDTVGEDCRFRLISAEGNELDRFEEKLFPTSERSSEGLRAWLSDVARRSPRYEIVISDDALLVTDISLPPAAAENLGEVLGFEMDRFTPFTAAEVIYGFRPLKTTPEAVRVRLALLPRRRIAALLSELARTGVAIDALVPSRNDAPPLVHGLDRTGSGSDGTARTRWLLAATAAALAALALYLPFHLKAARLDDVETRLAALKRDAMELRRLEDRLDEALRGARAVTRRKAEEPLTLDVLAEVTRVLPETAWAYRFDRSGAELTVQGEAEAATELLGRFEASPMFRNAAFRATVQRNAATGRDRYQIVTAIADTGKSDG